MSRIGDWATTATATRWHLIDSEVAGDVITRCGRRLHPSKVQPIRTHDTGLSLCFYCGYDDPVLRTIRFHRPTLNTRGPD